MPSAISSGSKIRTNIPAENSYNALVNNSEKIADKQLSLSTGKRINCASDDVSGYITSRYLEARNGALKSALISTGEALNVTSITQDALDNINSILTQIKDHTSSSASGALGTDEKIALAKSAYRLSEQIQTIADTAVFGGKQLLQGAFSTSWIIGYDAKDSLLKIYIDLTSSNSDFNIEGSNFNLNAIRQNEEILSSSPFLTRKFSDFAGVGGLNLICLHEVSSSNLGIYHSNQIDSTLYSLSIALKNVNNVASYIGGIQVRLQSQEDLLKSQHTNNSSAISRIQDADIAGEQLELIKAQFLRQTSLMSLAQSNLNPMYFLSLFSSGTNLATYSSPLNSSTYLAGNYFSPESLQ